MAVRFEKVRPGDVLWQVHCYKLRGKERGTLACFSVEILEIDYARGVASCSWNRGLPRVYTKDQIERLQRKRPKDAT